MRRLGTEEAEDVIRNVVSKSQVFKLQKYRWISLANRCRVRC